MGNRVISNRGRVNKILLAAGTIVLIVGYVLTFVYMDNDLLQKNIKTCMKIVEALLFMGYLVFSWKRIAEKQRSAVLTGFILYIAADIILNYQLYAGMICFALGHMVFIILFLRIHKAERKILSIWALIIAVVAAGTFIVGVKFIPLGLAVLIYSIFISGIFMLSLGIDRILTIGTGVYLLSDLCIALRTVVFKDSFALAVMVSVTYYFAIIAMAHYFLQISAGKNGDRD